MGETPGHRDAIDRMTKQIIQNNQGKISPSEAQKTAREAAIRHDKKKNR